MSRQPASVPLTSALDAAPFGREMRALRRGAGLTQAQAADRMGVSLRWLKYLETGTRRPRLHDVGRVAVMDPLTGRMAASVLQTLTPAGKITPSGPRLSLAHLARLAGWPLEHMDPSVSAAITPEALAVVADVLDAAHALLDQADPHMEDLDGLAATRNVSAVVHRLDHVYAALAAEDAR